MKVQRAITALLAGILLAVGAIAPVAASSRVPKVALVVGPVGSLTSEYRSLANEAAAVAKAAGAEVVKVYSPNATWPAVRDALTGASIVVYLGHGNGWPSRYRDSLYPPTQNGFGLNPVAGQDDANYQYFGESKIDNVKLAPNAVVLLHHLCYASGNTEPGLPEGSVDVATQRVDNYAAGFLRAGASAVVAEAHMGPAWYVRQLLTTNAKIEDIWNRSPEANGNLITANSTRTPGYMMRLDPDHKASGFYRSLVSKGVTTGQLRSGAQGDLQGAYMGPPPVPSLASAALKFGTLQLGALPIAATKTSVSIPVAGGNATAIPGGAEISLRWDPILLDAPVTAPQAPAASPGPSASPAASPSPTASPTPAPTPTSTATVKHGLFQLPGGGTSTSDPAGPAGPAASSVPQAVIPQEAPAVDLVVPERQGSVVEPKAAKRTGNGLAVDVTFPTQPGLYRLVPTLHTPDGTAYDAATQALLTPVLVRIGGRIAVAYGAPAALTIPASMDVTVPVRVLNSGSEAWDVSLTLQPGQGGGTGYHTSAFHAVLTGTWVSTTGAPVPAPSSAELDPSIAGPGGDVSVTLAVTAPSAPGEYLLLLDTISPARGSLSALGSAPALVRVTVTDPGPSPTPIPPQRQ